MTFGLPMAEALARYYRLLDGADLVGAAGCFADTAIYAVPPGGGLETGPRTIVVGRRAIADHFARRGPKSHVHDVQLCLGAGSEVLVEGVVRNGHGGEALGSFAASAWLDGAGLIGRYVAYRCNPPVSRPPTAGDRRRPRVARAATAVLEDALRRVRDRDSAGAESLLAEQVLVSWPSTSGGLREELHGPRQLLASGLLHRVLAPTVAVAHGPHGLVEGTMDGDGAARAGYLASVELGEDDRIDRLVGFVTIPAV